MQIYEIALYVDMAGAQVEFARLQKAGFFTDFGTETMCRALLQGKFSKLLQVKLLRNVSPSQLTGEIGRDLQPRLAKTGDQALWERFTHYVSDKEIKKGASFMALIRGKFHYACNP